VALAVYVSHSGLSEPDGAHTFVITYRGGVKYFYTPVVGVYLVVSGFIGVAGGLSLAVRRMFPERER